MCRCCQPADGWTDEAGAMSEEKFAATAQLLPAVAGESEA